MRAALALLSGVRGGALRKHYHGAIASVEAYAYRRKNKHLNLAEHRKTTITGQ